MNEHTVRQGLDRARVRQPPVIEFDGTSTTVGYHYNVVSERPDDRVTYERAPHPQQKDATFYAERVVVYLESPETSLDGHWRIDEVNIIGVRWDDSPGQVIHAPGVDGSWPNWIPTWASELADGLLKRENDGA